jgi:hypothetical protein
VARVGRDVSNGNVTKCHRQWRATIALQFKWNEKTSAAAIGLAEGKSHQQVADEIGVERVTVGVGLCNMATGYRETL